MAKGHIWTKEKYLTVKIEVLLLLLLLHLLPLASSLCPDNCSCMWKKGKETVICQNTQFSELPDMMESGTQVLDFTGNQLTVLANDVFVKNHLVNLQEVALPHCNINRIQKFALRSLTNLVKLDLSHNNLKFIPGYAFSLVTELRELDLSNNPIRAVQDNAFKSLRELVKLELRECQIESISVKAFVGLTKLEWLAMDKNFLTTISHFSFLPLANINGLDIHQNPWNCTCNMKPFIQWLERANVPYSISPICSDPKKLRHRPWSNLDVSDFACGPVSEPTNIPPIVRTTPGSNVTLSCSFKADPSPLIEWSWQGETIRNMSRPSSGEDMMYVVSEWGHHTKTSILTIVNVLKESRGLYKCRGFNTAGDRMESRTVEFIKVDVMEKLVKIKLYMIAAVGGCVVLFFSLIMAACIFHLRRKQEHKYMRQTSWCDSDSACGDKTLFRFGLRDNGSSHELIECSEIIHETQTSKESLLSDSLLTSHSNGYSDSIKSDVLKPRQYYTHKGFYHAVPTQCEEENVPQMKIECNPSDYNLKHTCQPTENQQGISQHLSASLNQQNHQVKRVQELQDVIESPSSTDSSSDSGVCLYPEQIGSTERVRFYTHPAKPCQLNRQGETHLSASEGACHEWNIYSKHSDTSSEQTPSHNGDEPVRPCTEDHNESALTIRSSNIDQNFITRGQRSVNYLDNSSVAKDIIVSPPSPLRREQKGRFAVIRDERSPHSSDTCSPLTYDASESDISQSTETKSDIHNPPVKKKHSVTFAQRECDIREFVPDSGEFENGPPPQIDKFTEEYLGLQEQLKKMKEVCDKLKQTNLRNDLEDLQFTMRKFENSSVAHNVGHLRERYKLISQMISDAQRSESEDGSFCTGEDSSSFYTGSDYTDLTRK